MANNSDNTVSSKNQLSKEECVFGCEGSGKRILFIGNSITRHGKSEGIGWFNDWGMAASSMAKDYVHLTMHRVYENNPDAAFQVIQLSVWEREFWNEKLVEEQFPEALKFNPDIIVMRIVENTPVDLMRLHDFEASYINLVKSLDTKKTAEVIITSSFWPVEEKDKHLKSIAEKLNCKYVYLGDLGSNDKYTAKGLFEHSGVAAHPGDAGMQAISDRIFDAIEEYL